MTPEQQAAMRMALDALESFDGVGDVVTWEKQWRFCHAAITALRQALEQQPSVVSIDTLQERVENSKQNRHEQQPADEPDAVHQYRVPLCSDWYDGIPDHHDGHGPYEVRTLYTRPQPAAQWVGLTDEEVDKLDWGPRPDEPMTFQEGLRDFYRAIEAKLREKNTGEKK